MTVFENIAYGLRSRHAPTKLINERVEKLPNPSVSTICYIVSRAN